MSEQLADPQVIAAESTNRPAGKRPGRRSIWIAVAILVLSVTGHVSMIAMTWNGALTPDDFVYSERLPLNVLGYGTLVAMAGSFLLLLVAGIRSIRAKLTRRGVLSILAALAVPGMVLFSAVMVAVMTTTIAQYRAEKAVVATDERAMDLIAEWTGASASDIEAMIADVYYLDAGQDVIGSGAPGDIVEPLLIAKDAVEKTDSGYEYVVRGIDVKTGKLFPDDETTTHQPIDTEEHALLLKKLIDNRPKYTENIMDLVETLQAVAAGYAVYDQYPSIEYQVQGHNVTLVAPGTDYSESWQFKNVSEETLRSLFERAGFNVVK